MKVKASDRKSEKLNVSGYKRHIFICIGPKCCNQEKGLELWQYIKDRLNDMKLANVPNAPIFRTKAACLRICSDGPIAVVYPEGTWYRLLNNEGVDRIIEEHLINGQEVLEYKLERNSDIVSNLNKCLPS